MSATRVWIVEYRDLKGRWRRWYSDTNYYDTKMSAESAIRGEYRKRPGIAMRATAYERKIKAWTKEPWTKEPRP